MGKKTRNLTIGCVGAGLALLYWPMEDRAVRTAASPVQVPVAESTIQDLLFGEEPLLERPAASCRVVEERRSAPQGNWTKMVGRIEGGTDWTGFVDLTAYDANGAMVDRQPAAPSADGGFTVYFDATNIRSVSCSHQTLVAEPTIQDLLFSREPLLERPAASCQVVEERRSAPQGNWTRMVGRIEGGTDWTGFVDLTAYDANGAMVDRQPAAPSADGGFTVYFDATNIRSVSCSY